MNIVHVYEYFGYSNGKCSIDAAAWRKIGSSYPDLLYAESGTTLGQHRKRWYKIVPTVYLNMIITLNNTMRK